MKYYYYPHLQMRKLRQRLVISQGYPAGIGGKITTQTDQRSSVVCQSLTATMTLHKQPHGLNGLSQEALSYLTS